MVIAAFIITTIGALLVLGMIQGAQRARREHGRETLQSELGVFLEDAAATDAEHGSGSYHGLPVTVDIEHHVIAFKVKLGSAVVPFRELVERHAPAVLKHRLAELGVTIDAADCACGAVPREAGLSENLVSIAMRLPAVLAVHELRRFAPGELLTKIDRARASADIDQILLQLTRHFPDAPETQDAIDLAAEREHSHPDRVRERAQRWLQRAL